MGKKIKRVHELATHKRNNVCFFFKCSPPSLITKVMEKKKNIDIGNKSASCQWWNVNLVKIWGMGNWIQEQGDEMGTVENGINGKKGKELGSKL